MKIVSILLAALLLAGCGSEQEEKQRAIEEEPAADIIRLSDAQLAAFEREEVQLTRKAIRRTVRLNGTADVPPQNRVSVSHTMGGYVQAIHLLPGMPFRKGQVLAVLENEEYIQLQHDYLIAATELERVRLNYERQQTLNENKASSDKNFQSATAEYQALRITWNALREKLRLVGADPDKLTATNITRQIQIHAPFNGVVGDVFVNQGKYVLPSDVLLELIDPKDLLLELRVFERDWPYIAAGQELMAYTNERPDQRVQGKVVARGNQINPDGTAAIHVQLHNPASADIAPGMYVNAVVEIQASEVYALPEKAVVTYEGNPYVVEVLDDHAFGLMAVQTGAADSGFVEIVDGQQLQDKSILGNGAYTVLMGIKNKVEK